MILCLMMVARAWPGSLLRTIVIFGGIGSVLVFSLGYSWWIFRRLES